MNEWSKVFDEYEQLRSDVDDLIDTLLDMSNTGRKEPCWCKKQNSMAAWLHDQNCMEIRDLIKNSSLKRS